MVQKFGIEGIMLLTEQDKEVLGVRIEVNADKDEAVIVDGRNKQQTRQKVKIFDNVMVEIKA